MKTYFTFLCLIISGGLASATIQNKANPDKPPVVFVDQHSDQWAQSDTYWNGLNLNVGGSKKYAATIDNTGYLSYQASGTFLYHDETGTSWLDSSYNWSDINPTGTFSITTTNDEFDDALTGAGYGNIFTPFPYSVPSVSLASGGGFLSHFYANINYDWNQPDCVDATKMNYSRNTKTFMKLKTGGKVGINRQNLFSISASATEYERPECIDWADAPDYWINATATSIDPTRIRVLGKNVGNDGNLYTVLPDNATLDLAASAPGKHYSLNVSAQKYKLNILANGNPLSDDHVRRGAYFCVGGKVNFQAVFSPSLSPAETYPTWYYTADYINNHWTDANGCEQYNISPFIQISNPTKAWFYNNQTQDAIALLEMTCVFANGQSVYLSRQGKFNVFTPSIQFFPDSGSNAVVEVRHDPVNGNGNVTYLGIGDDDQNDAMRFSAMITSIPKFPGQAIATQLINRQEFLYALFGNVPLGTGGTNDLDKSEIYSSASLTNYPGFPNMNPHGQVDFFDSPGIGLSYASPTPYLVASWTAWASCNDHFNTYFRFKPDGDADNIYVTLGRVDWDWHGTVQYIGGFPSDPYPLTNWQVSGTGHGGPAFYPANDFPIWPAVY